MKFSIIDDGTFQKLLEQIYATVDDRTKWKTFLQTLFRFYGAHMGSLINFGEPDFQAILVGSEQAQGPWLSYYNKLDPWNELSFRRLPSRGAMMTASHWEVEDRQLERTEFYNDFAHPIGYDYGLAIGVGLASGSRYLISAVREKKAGPVGEDELAELKPLVPHLQRALELGEAMESLAVQNETLLHSIDALQCGLVLVDSRSRIVCANRMARSIAALKDGFALGRNGVEASQPGDTAALQKMIQTAASPLSPGKRPGGAITLARPSGRTPWVVHVIPHSGWSERRLAALLVRNPEIDVSANPQIVAKVLGLTPAEACVALRLMRGERVQDIAQELRITINTARTHVQRILSKAGVRRQSELIVLLTKLAGPA